MDIALELLDFLNFDLKDERAFKKVVAEKELVKGVSYPYDVYNRLMALAQAPFNRTSQLVKEWLEMRLKACAFKDATGAHVYSASVPERQPGMLQVKVEREKDQVYCHVVRTAYWQPNLSMRAQITGGKMMESLEVLIGSMYRWFGVRLPLEDARKEMAHYFTHLAGSPQQPYGFAGFMKYDSRSVIVNVGLSTIADSVEATVDVQNYKLAK